jgi:cytochrome c2
VPGALRIELEVAESTSVAVDAKVVEVPLQLATERFGLLVHRKMPVAPTPFVDGRNGPPLPCNTCLAAEAPSVPLHIFAPRQRKAKEVEASGTSTPALTRRRRVLHRSARPSPSSGFAVLHPGQLNPWASGTSFTELITAAHTPHRLRIAVVVTFDVARLVSDLPAQLWSSCNLTSQVTAQNFMMFSCFSFLSDQHCLIAPGDGSFERPHHVELALIFGIVICAGVMARGIGSASKKSIDRGSAVYHSECAHCHQADGRGDGGRVAPDFVGNPAWLAKSDRVLLHSIEEGVPGTAMLAFGERLSERERLDALAFIRSSFGKRK